MPQTTAKSGWESVQLDQVQGVSCSCGLSRRAFEGAADLPGSIHRTDISETARTHYHKQLTEIYYVLECEPDAKLELDGEDLPVQIGTCVLIRPGVRHRAVGKMTVLILVVPKYDAADEWFD